MKKAVISPVSISSLEIEGLMAEDGEFGIGVPQLVSHNLVGQNNSNREVKTYMGNGFQLVKWRTTLNPNPVNVILLPDFEKLLRKMDKSGNKAAEAMVDDLVGLSLTQLFSDAFGQKFEKEERQQWLKTRQAGVISRRTLTDTIKSYIDRANPTENYRRWVYGNVTDKIYSRLLGGTAKELEILLGCIGKEKTRDKLSFMALRELDRTEDNIGQLIDSGLEPMEAVENYFNSVLAREVKLAETAEAPRSIRFG